MHAALLLIRALYDCSFLLLYGSQTGAAKSIAENIHAESASHGFACTLAPLNDYAKVRMDLNCCVLYPSAGSTTLITLLALPQIGFVGAPVVVIVTSTTGNGDPPNNAEE